MAEQVRESATCVCGKVVFDLSDRKVGDPLSCPWCQRSSRYLGDGKLETEKTSAGRKIAAEPAIKERAGAEPAAKPNLIAVGGPQVQRENRESVRHRKPATIPGGMWAMIAFIVTFNALAFVALALLFPRQPDNSRLTPWGILWSKETLWIWPEISALLTGHVVGFMAWVCFAYIVFQRRRAATAVLTESSRP